MKQKVVSLGKRVKFAFTQSKNRTRNYVILAIALIGITSLIATQAAGFSISVETEQGTRTSCATQISDTSASAGSAVQFGCSGTSTVGANLPITYDLNSLTGTVLYASPNGSTSSTCTSSTPCTLSRAVSQVTTANSTVVLRGGIYRDQRNITIGGSSKTGLKLIAYPNETPEIYGSTAVPSSSGGGWTTEGTYQYRSYLPRPVREGGGVAFDNLSSFDNLSGDGVGRYPDQAWIGSTPLKEVLNKTQLTDGKFFVDRTNNRIYLTATDAAKPNIETSRPGTGDLNDRDRLFSLQTSGITLEGIRITRFSPNANDYGVITVENTAPNSTIKNVEISHLPYTGIHYGNANVGPKLQNITAFNVGWQTIVADRTDRFTMDAAKITNADFFDEFNSSPASGALKTSRTRDTTVTNSEIDNNKSHGLWFDQSNINTVVANTKMRDNTGAGIFFEISDGLLLINSYVRASGSVYAMRLVGSSGIRLINNTSVGGANPFGIYTDSRSIAGCSTRTTSNPCPSSIPSDLQTVYPIPSTLDWMPRIDYMANNIFAYPTGTYICASTAACYNTTNSSANRPIETIIHKADPARGIPQTFIDGNVYANGSSSLVRVSTPAAAYSTLSAWTSAMAGSPVGIPGIDANSKSGNSWVNTNGSPTASLEAVHNEAVPVPTDSVVNKYIPAGTRRYGVTYTIQ